MGVCKDQAAVIDANGDIIPDMICNSLQMVDNKPRFDSAFLINNGDGKFTNM